MINFEELERICAFLPLRDNIEDGELLAIQRHSQACTLGFEVKLVKRIMFLEKEVLRLKKMVYAQNQISIDHSNLNGGESVEWIDEINAK